MKTLAGSIAPNKSVLLQQPGIPFVNSVVFFLAYSIALLGTFSLLLFLMA